MIPAYYFPVIPIGDFEIPVYPLAHSLGYVAAGIIILIEARRRKADLNIIYNTLLLGFVGAIVGARIGGMLTNPDFFLSNPREIINLGSGGWTESGGFVLSMILMFGYLYKKKFSSLAFFDMAAPALSLRFAISRFGCGAVHDHIGKVMQHPFPWGVEYEGVVRHETGLYSLVSNAVIFLILWNLRKRMKTRGMLFVTYLVLYSISVFIIRFFRAENLLYVSNERYYGLTVTQYIVIAVFISAIFLYKYIKKNPVPFDAPFYNKK